MAEMIASLGLFFWEDVGFSDIYLPGEGVGRP